MESVLLLTACVDPGGMTFTKLQDKDIRLKQYITALQWYLDYTTLPIVFVENTGYDMSPYFLNSTNNHRLEIFTFQGNSYDKQLGKGYGEGRIIEYAFEHSRFIQHSEQIIKVTGRLICKNINQIVRRCKKADTVYAIVGGSVNKAMRCSSQVMVSPPSFLKNYFLPYINLIDDSVHYNFENLLYDCVVKWKCDGYSFQEFWFPPILKGVSGTKGTDINSGSIKSQVKFYLHYVSHFFGYYGPIRYILK